MLNLIVIVILAPLGPPIVIPVHNIRTTSALIEWEEIPHAVQYKLAAWSRDDQHYGLYSPQFIPDIAGL